MDILRIAIDRVDNGDFNEPIRKLLRRHSAEQDRLKNSGSLYILAELKLKKKA